MATPHPTTLPLDPDGHLYVFGYGSLIWRPGFGHAAAHPALLRGFHRRFCIWSRYYRGTAEAPGLVLGLDRGGACRGLAFDVAPEDREAVVAYLREREQVTLVYREAVWPVRLDDGLRVGALVYVVDRSHPQYAGVLSLDEQVDRVRHGVGKAGPNADYVRNTVALLASMGVRDVRLEAVVARL